MIRLLYKFSKILEAIFWQQDYISSVPNRALLMQDVVHMYHDQCSIKDRLILEIKPNQEKALSMSERGYLVQEVVTTHTVPLT